MQLLGIYEDAINKAIETCEEAMTQFAFTDREINDMHDMAIDELEEAGDWRHITDSIIGAYYRVTADLIRQTDAKVDVDYYVNCRDSHFYINGQEV
jgi:hypothetical protein